MPRFIDISVPKEILTGCGGACFSRLPYWGGNTHRPGDLSDPVSDRLEIKKRLPNQLHSRRTDW